MSVVSSLMRGMDVCMCKCSADSDGKAALAPNSRSICLLFEVNRISIQDPVSTDRGATISRLKEGVTILCGDVPRIMRKS